VGNSDSGAVRIVKNTEMMRVIKKEISARKTIFCFGVMSPLYNRTYLLHPSLLDKDTDKHSIRREQ
jgi:hypothetical protein